MAYITLAQYNAFKYKNPQDAHGNDVFDRLVKWAEDDIDYETDYRIKRRGFENYPDFAKEQIVKAMAAQIDYMIGNGTRLDEYAAIDGAVGSASQQDARKVQNEQQVTERARRALLSAGLLYSGLNRTSRIDVANRVPGYGRTPFDED